MINVAHGSDDPIRIPAALDRRNRFRHFSTQELLTERAFYQWYLVEMLADLEQDSGSWANPEESLNYILTAIEDIDVVLDRRRSLRSRPGAPTWPRPSRRRQEELRAEAESLRSQWPLDCFCMAVLGVGLQRRGRELVGRCPFPDHEDKHPSFTVSADSRLWYCWGCHRGGDIFTLIGQLHALDGFAEQVHFLKQRTGGMRGTM